MRITVLGILLFFSLWITDIPVIAQTVHFQMSVEPEIGAEVLQALNFGQYLAGSGKHEISEGSPEAGVFRIKGIPGQQVLVSLDIPSYLSHNKPDSESRIPVSLKASYNHIRNNPGTALPITNNETAFALRKTTTRADNFWAFAYIYIFGTSTIGDVASGSYTGDVVLTVEYP